MAVYRASLIFIPFPVISHLLATIKMAKLLTNRDERLSITVLIMKLQSDNKLSSYTKNSSDSRINFVEIERDDSKFAELIKSPKNMVPRFAQTQTAAVRAAVSSITRSPKHTKLAGFFVDVLCTSMIDVAAELDVPAYIFFTCGAAVLGLMFRLQGLMDGRDDELAEYEDSDAEVLVSTYVNPVPAKVWPSAVFDGESGFFDLTRKLKQASGIVVNTFLELQPHAITALTSDDRIPTVYPVGPLLQDEADDGGSKRVEILRWLDDQPDSSVVFLCFGTNGCFNEDQVREIAAALETCGRRFLWSLGKPPSSETGDSVGEYENHEEVLPEGFLERTARIGMVIGWAPQMAVLSHPAVGGFVSHCGWNSILESIWCGVPMATWPMYAEQQANAFEMVNELKIAIDIKMDYRKFRNVIVDAHTIEKAIKQLMQEENKIRVNVKELREKSTSALMEGGSSHDFVARLIENVTQNFKPL
ncbi:hypothetical protein C2S52_012167 [Perilla frutescens var. hirtella]|nr:hypothetical protein C2S52_012167 [Perilla frutescens var. hirtella]